MGLWQGCREANGSWMCTNEIFEDEVFQSGSDWHVGSQVMMTLALILLFLLEFVLLGYVCIHRFQKYKNKLVAFIIGLSVSAGALTLTTIILVAIEASRAPRGHLEWSYGMLLLALSFEILCFGIVLFNAYQNRLLGKSMTRASERRDMVETASMDDNPFSYVNQTFTIVDLHLDETAY
ncbi:hypothetical protein MAR_037134 [Mya arenaria]|uniref:Uncharacterized protein n=1 Tax=Mya arenaria TaxID=6604 RepID=A0ABY7FMN9_MYAAR|nr:hypothetical protein MAR_037134 [Mya arenaria]